MTTWRRILTTTGLIMTALAMSACEPYRVEYHRRPAWHARMVDGPLPDRTVLDDGTVILYNQKSSAGAFTPSSDSNHFRIRRENPDGTVSLHAHTPEHVLLNALNSIRGGEYRLIWDELLSERMKMRYAEEGLGFEAFEQFLRENRVDLGRTLTRMSIGLSMQDAAVTTIAPGHYRVQFWPHIINASPTRGGGFKFNYVEIVRESFSLKLHTIY